MKRIVVLLLFGMAACGQEPSDRAAAQTSAKPVPMATAPQSKMSASAIAAKAGVLPIPEDKQQLQRLLAMGYTRHEDHLHPPGMKECPFNMGGSMVQ
jgi:hypothetical protein